MLCPWMRCYGYCINFIATAWSILLLNECNRCCWPEGTTIVWFTRVWSTAWCTVWHDAQQPCHMNVMAVACLLYWCHCYWTASLLHEFSYTFLTGIGVSSSLLQAGMLSLWVLLQADMFLVCNTMPTLLLHHSLTMHFSYLIPAISTDSCIIYFHYWPPTNVSNLFCPSSHPFTLHH